MTIRCLQIFVLAIVAAASLASESADTSSKTHANLRYVHTHTEPRTQPRDMHPLLYLARTPPC